jgi:riboflavin synthase
MFTGIIEAEAQVVAIQKEGTNLRFTFTSLLAGELKVDQSVAHNGVCLTVERVLPEVHQYEVVAIDETLQKTNLGNLKPGHLVNLERAMQAGARLDGHFVQGHVDTTGSVLGVSEENGSWRYRFAYPPEHAELVIPKGSIAINGVSLTVVDAEADWFSVAIIPYTYVHTTFRLLQPNDRVNLEFDMLGKYVARAFKLRAECGQ